MRECGVWEQSVEWIFGRKGQKKSRGCKKFHKDAIFNSATSIDQKKSCEKYEVFTVFVVKITLCRDVTSWKLLSAGIWRHGGYCLHGCDVMKVMWRHRGYCKLGCDVTNFTVWRDVTLCRLFSAGISRHEMCCLLGCDAINVTFCWDVT
jgi:hypothetical protein